MNLFDTFVHFYEQRKLRADRRARNRLQREKVGGCGGEGSRGSLHWRFMPTEVNVLHRPVAYWYWDLILSWLGIFSFYLDIVDGPVDGLLVLLAVTFNFDCIPFHFRRLRLVRNWRKRSRRDRRPSRGRSHVTTVQTEERDEGRDVCTISRRRAPWRCPSPQLLSGIGWVVPQAYLHARVYVYFRGASVCIVTSFGVSEDRQLSSFVGHFITF